MRLIGLDYGEKTVGVAFTDALGMTAIPGETIFREKENHLRKTLSKIGELVSERQTEKIILGFPVHLDGTDSPISEKVKAFQKLLEARVEIPVELFDERLTTFSADELLSEMEIPKKKRKEVIDSLSAAVLLRDYMNEKELKEKK